MEDKQRPVSANTRDRNAGIEDCLLSRAIKKEKQQEEERRSRFAKKVITEHERTERSASASSARAKNEQQNMEKEIIMSKATIKEAKMEEEKFDNKMESIIQDEVERIEEEKQLEEDIKSNHGKMPGYFKVPNMMKDKTNEINRKRSRSPRSRMLHAAKTLEQNPLTNPKPLPEGVSATIGPASGPPSKPKGMAALKLKSNHSLGPSKAEKKEGGIRVTSLAAENTML